MTELGATLRGAPPNASPETLWGVSIRIASLDHLIAMKEAAGRDKDKLHASEYRVISDLLRAPKADEPS